MALRYPRKRKRRVMRGRALLDMSQVLAWADEFHQRHGRWPTLNSGRIAGTLDETWRRVDSALRLGLRGLPGGVSLARFLVEKRGARNHTNLPRLSIKQVLAWADAHQKRTGQWPRETAGPVHESPQEGWHAVDRALRAGVRGLPRGSSLARLLAKHRRVRNIQELPRLSVEKILTWADRHRRRTGRWPTSQMGTIAEAPTETWSAVNAALQLGRRGMQGGISLVQLLAKHRGARNAKHLTRLTQQQVLAWADAHHARTGQWPSRKSGVVVGSNGDTWACIDRALMNGQRGLAAGQSLFRLLKKHRGLKLERRPAKRKGAQTK